MRVSATRKQLKHTLVEGGWRTPHLHGHQGLSLGGGRGCAIAHERESHALLSSVVLYWPPVPHLGTWEVIARVCECELRSACERASRGVGVRGVWVCDDPLVWVPRVDRLAHRIASSMRLRCLGITPLPRSARLLHGLNNGVCVLDTTPRLAMCVCVCVCVWREGCLVYAPRYGNRE